MKGMRIMNHGQSAGSPRYYDYTKKWERLVGEKFGTGYSSIYYDQNWITDIIRPVVEVAKSGRKTFTLADFGCGSGIVGLNAIKAIESFRKVDPYLIDINSRQLEGIAEESKRLAVSSSYRIINGNMLDLQLPAASFNGIVGRLFLHHLTKEDNERIWSHIAKMLSPSGIASIYHMAPTNEGAANFIREVYRWRSIKSGVSSGYIDDTDSICLKLDSISDIDYSIVHEVRGPLFVSGKGSIQEKMGLSESEMTELEDLFANTDNNVKNECRIEAVSNAGLAGNGISTHCVFWPCQLTVIRKFNQ